MINTMLANLYQLRDISKIAEIKNTLSQEVQTLDVFFDEYLELFDEQMNSSIEDISSPAWKAYQDKYKEYLAVKADLKMANYYLSML